MKVRLFEAAEDLAEALAGELRTVLEQPERPGPAVMLAGGRTPLAGYERLAARPLRCLRDAAVFLSDERHVPAASPENNGRAIAPFLRRVGLCGERILRVDTSLALDDAAADYDRRLDAMVREGRPFPLGLLGVGSDGHTASLFSSGDVKAAIASGRWAIAVRRSPPPDRLSVTPQLLRRVEKILFVLTGADKAVVGRALTREPAALPAGLAVAGHPCVELWMDRAAAG